MLWLASKYVFQTPLCHQNANWSSVPSENFPPPALNALRSISRTTAQGPDIRGYKVCDMSYEFPKYLFVASGTRKLTIAILQDSQNRSAGEVAAGMGHVWKELLDSGILFT